MEKKFKYSEIFGRTFQGEGRYTGVPTAWVRFWGCNLECNGFGQKNPRDPSSYDLSYQTIDVSSITRMEDLPVFNTGCDSSYSWAKKFAHLAHTSTADEIADKLEKVITNEFNPQGKFLHPRRRGQTHLAFTGGEPMMNQTGIVEILTSLERRNNLPGHITIETNGTQSVRQPFREYFNYYAGELFWSVSPKLSLSGEDISKTIKPEVVAEYAGIDQRGQLKFVCDTDPRTWDEVEQAVELFEDAGIDWPVWIMPVGATVEGQRSVAAQVAEMAVDRGYNVAARVHAYVFDNVIGK